MSKGMKMIPCCLVLLLSVASGCDNIKSVSTGDVALVKSGTLEIDKSLTVGQAIDNYKFFKMVEWEALKTENGKRLVQVNADFDIEKSPTLNAIIPGLKSAQYQFQFQINTDDTFQVGWCGIEFEKTDGTKVEASQTTPVENCLNSLKGIYNNNPDI